MTKLDLLLEELIDSQVNHLIQNDAYYDMLATPLKSAASIKKAHRQQLIDFFKLTELQKELGEAPGLILTYLPHLISKEEFAKVKGELDRSYDQFISFIEAFPETPVEKPVLFQEIYGLSDDTLLYIYSLGVDFVKKGNYDEANTLFVFLTTMAPHVSSYWIAEGACLQALDRHTEAVAVFNAVKFLNPSDPTPLIYTLESYLALKDQDRAKLELSALKKMIKSLQSDEKILYEEKIRELGFS